jgi:hypothetical protein
MKRGRPGPGNCGACRHERRHLIDIGLVCQVPRSTLAARFEISEDTLARHAANHLPPQVRAAILTQMKPSEIDLEALQRNESESLLASLISQRARLATMAAQALEADLPGIAVRCEASILSNLELVSKLLGQLVHRTEITSRSILISPDYLRLRAILIEELLPHPEIASRIAERIAALENEAAAELTLKPNAAPILIEAQP